ncbi:MAG: hypothetical protein AAF361_14775, partial [Bacteroidota bacterium]
NQIDTQQGKLTLTSVHFTYGFNYQGQLNPYHFKYNPIEKGYNIGHVDRWGTYKQNDASLPPNHEYPYAVQDQMIADENAAAWNLTEITLPSGGKIKVEYESDDYAYVQNKRAGQMFMVSGFSGTTTGTGTGELYSSLSSFNKFMVIDNLSATDKDDAIRKYLDGMNHIYFQSLVDLNSGGAHEYVKGYVDFSSEEIEFDNGRLYIPVNPINVRGGQAHPISYAAWQKLRLELPEVAYDDDGDGDIFPGADFIGIKDLWGLRNSIGKALNGFAAWATDPDRYWGRYADINNRTWVRLQNPDYKKYGGGSRVKRLVLTDEWNIPDAGPASEYGQTYSYEKEIMIDGQPTLISSGVASYEPFIGGEENSMRQPLPYVEKRLLAPDNRYYTETPVGESLFPTPVVGYSQVTVRNLQYENVIGTGHTINKFYTAKDFPVKVDFTRKDSKRVKSNPLVRLFKIGSKDFLSLSQGFVVEVNDMHGKPTSVETYNESGALLSSTHYQYKVDEENAENLHLNNLVKVAQRNGNTAQIELGLDIDVWQEMHEESNATKAVGLALNTEGFVLPFPIPIPFIGVFPSAMYQTEKTRLQTAVNTKLIKRCGILEKVIAMDNGSTITTENVLFDGETGDVLLTKTQNEFNDAMYQFSYPAHWAYEGMGQAYQNINALMTSE